MKGRPDYIAPQDLKFVKVDPDPNFDPAHNKKVIEKTIKDNQRLVRERQRESLEGVKERHNALAVYLRSVNQGGKASDYKKFFGEKNLKRLKGYVRGMEVMENIKKQMVLQGRNDAFFNIELSESSRSKVKKM
ncbi:MAG: hypothetical protein AABY22_01815, partial [Nanoarchaeota archaeon]